MPPVPAGCTLFFKKNILARAGGYILLLVFSYFKFFTCLILADCKMEHAEEEEEAVHASKGARAHRCTLKSQQKGRERRVRGRRALPLFAL
jgi:hypothetical protein